MAGELYASGNWHVNPGSEDDFVAAWRGLLEWTKSNHPGFLTARLIQDETDTSHFVSFARWESKEARDAWRAHPEFPDRFSKVRALCDDMYGADYTSQLEF